MTTVLLFMQSVYSTTKKLKINIYRTIILPAVLYGCETWSLTLREESRLKLFENRVLRRVFGPKRDDVTGEWRKLYNGELSDLYSLPNIVQVVKSKTNPLLFQVLHKYQAWNATIVTVIHDFRLQPRCK